MKCSSAVKVFASSLLVLELAGIAVADPTNVSIAPPDGARLLAGQKFDLRVQGRGEGPFYATIAIDGVPLEFTSGAQGTTTTDGISAAGYGGFNLRGYSNGSPGRHTITASFTDSTGTVNTAAAFEIVNLTGHHRAIKNIIILLGDGMGVAHRTAARLVKYGVTKGNPNGYLAMDQLPGTGLVTTHSLNSIVTDSAPGMACYASGSHTNNGQEGVYPGNLINAFYAPRIDTWPSTFTGRTALRSGWSPPRILKTQPRQRTRSTPPTAMRAPGCAINTWMKAIRITADCMEPA